MRFYRKTPKNWMITEPVKLPSQLGLRKNMIWTDMAEWLKKWAPQEIILEELKRLYRELEPISQFEDDSNIGKEADIIRDKCDILWYALDTSTVNKLENWLKKEKIQKESGQSINL